MPNCVDAELSPEGECAKNHNWLVTLILKMKSEKLSETPDKTATMKNKGEDHLEQTKGDDYEGQSNGKDKEWEETK